MDPHPLTTGWIGRRGSDASGLTMIELLAAMVIVGILATLGMRSGAQFVHGSRVRQATVDILELQARIDEYALASNSLPSTLADVGRGGARDPWGYAYVYVPFSDEKVIDDARQDKFLKPLNSTYDLYSIGPDGRTDKKITSDKSQDDIIRANDGGYVGLAATF